jgi:hypothetical protein
MSLFDPAFVAQEFAAALLSGSPDDEAPYLGDRHQRLLEAGLLGGGAEVDLLALMPSVDRPERPWTDGKAWLRRVLGF